MYPENGSELHTQFTASPIPEITICRLSCQTIAIRQVRTEPWCRSGCLPLVDSPNKHKRVETRYIELDHPDHSNDQRNRRLYMH